jgi:hypothetical protein
MKTFKASTIGLALAQGGLKAALLATKAALLAHPFAIAAVAIGALVAGGILLWKNWDKVKAKAVELGDGIKAAFRGLREWIGGILKGIAGTFKGYINNYIRTANFLIGGLNKIQFEVPDWVPGIGGKQLGVNISKIPEFKVGINRVPRDMM